MEVDRRLITCPHCGAPIGYKAGVVTESRSQELPDLTFLGDVKAVAFDEAYRAPSYGGPDYGFAAAVLRQAAGSYFFFALIAYANGASAWLWFVAIPVSLGFGFLRARDSQPSTATTEVPDIESKRDLDSPLGTAVVLPDGFKSLRQVTRVLILGLGLTIIVNSLEVPALINQIDAGGPQAAENGLLSATTTAYGLPAIITIPSFLYWVYRAYKNLFVLVPGELPRSPIWAAFSFLIPVGNLWLPYKAMSEIWRGGGANETAIRWQESPNHPLMGFWWALWLIGGTTGYSVLSFIANNDDMSAYYARLGIDLVLIAAAVLAIVLVRQSVRRQEVAVALLAR